MILYLCAVAGVSLGMFLHVILFNLYLSDLGLREDLMGRLTAAMSLGTAAGTLPASALVARWGLKRAICFSLTGLAVALAVRVGFVSPAALVSSSFLSGLFLAGWHVTNAPAIAALAGGSNRATAFSMNISLSIAVGALGGVLAGVLPGLFHSKRAVLLLAAVLVLAGTVFVAATALGGEAASAPLRLSRPARGFLARFLGSLLLWYAFLAGFSPFFNVYLSRLGASTGVIGGVFALSQVAQALAALWVARWISRWGIVRAVVATQLLASAAVLGLLPITAVPLAAGFYVLYMSFQVMSEPGLQNFLMDGVPAEDRTTAAALNLLLLLGVHALVAWGAGWLIARQGYPLLFVALSATGTLAAVIFRMVFRTTSTA